MPFSLRRTNPRAWSLIAVGIVVLFSLALWLMMRHLAPSGPTSTNVTDTSVRSRYAALYQAAWRSDEGTGAITMTATLLTPELLESLSQDGERSSAEEQLWQASKDLSDQQIGVFMTIDSAAGAVPDETVRQSLTLTADGHTWTLKKWDPLIIPSHIVNTSQSVTSQTGVVIFEASQPVVWRDLQNLTLRARNIGGVGIRSFVWTRPGLLSQLP